MHKQSGCDNDPLLTGVLVAVEDILIVIADLLVAVEDLLVVVADFLIAIPVRL